MENTRSNSYALNCMPSWEAGWTLPPSHSTLPTRWATPFPCIHMVYIAPTLPVMEPLGLSMLCLSNLYAVVKPWPKMLPVCISLPLLTETLEYFIAPQEEKGQQKTVFWEKTYSIELCGFVYAFWERIPLTQTSGWPWASYLQHC